jgi:hypothetical protein
MFMYQCAKKKDTVLKKHVWGLKGEGSLTSMGGGGVGDGCAHMGLSSYNMGLEWTGFCVCVTRVTYLSKGLKLR